MNNPFKIVLVCCPECQKWMESRNENKVPRHSNCESHGVKPAGLVK